MERLIFAPEEEVQPRLGLGEYNRRFFRETADLSCCVERDGVCLGGITAWRADELVMVDLLWVADDCRGSGLGRRLLEAVEAEGRRLGALRVEVNTFGFQAPGFYEKLGYERFAAVEPAIGAWGHYFYLKKL